MLKDLEADAGLPADDRHRAEKKIQRLTDEYVKKIDEHDRPEGTGDPPGLTGRTALPGAPFPTCTSGASEPKRFPARRHHHGRQRALGGAPRARAHRGPPRGHRGGARGRARRARARRRVLTLYAFSTENWNRPKAEVDALMRLLEHYLEAELDGGDPQRHPGARDRPARAAARRSARAASTRRSSARATTREMTARLRALLRRPRRDRRRGAQARARRRAGQARSRALDEKTFAAYLYEPELPDPDLLIRTGGERAHLELPALADRLRRAPRHRRDVARLPQEPSGRGDLLDYQQRERRFGLTSEQVRGGAGGGSRRVKRPRRARQHGQRRRADARRRGRVPGALRGRRARGGPQRREARGAGAALPAGARLGRRRGDAPRALRERLGAEAPPIEVGAAGLDAVASATRISSCRRWSGAVGPRARRSPRSAPAATSRSPTRKCW